MTLPARATRGAGPGRAGALALIRPGPRRLLTAAIAAAAPPIHPIGGNY